MKVRLFSTIFFMLILTGVSADITSVLAEADELNLNEDYVREEALLNDLMKNAATPKEKAEVFWRLSRATLYLGEQAVARAEAKDKVLKIYEKGEKFADQALELDKTQAMAYYWKASNMGKWGTEKGILDALGKANPMRESLVKCLIQKPDHPDSYYVLGQLFEKVPGFPLSFGNPDIAVSLGRLSVDLINREYASGMRKKISYDFPLQLASHLAVRNWDSATRLREQPRKASRYKTEKDPAEKGYVYEGTVTLQRVSDKEEAVQILRKLISDMEALPSRTPGQEKDLADARELFKKLS